MLQVGNSAMLVIRFRSRLNASRNRKLVDCLVIVAAFFQVSLMRPTRSF